ncbi:ribosomal RNA small subunit methyltransferase A [Striga asiatica]|uniref:Ribosomal RNA small subunit methyltransferase A n=1 Tax=Striga asiatica TaxID=4170 RepID=A0A5A7Q857_STRAF|nr:ribosomal RNA small subunit methyltransferase A [Striga asiatica]
MITVHDYRTPNLTHSIGPYQRSRQHNPFVNNPSDYHIKQSLLPRLAEPQDPRLHRDVMGRAHTRRHSVSASSGPHVSDGSSEFYDKRRGFVPAPRLDLSGQGRKVTNQDEMISRKQLHLSRAGTTLMFLTLYCILRIFYLKGNLKARPKGKRLPVFLHQFTFKISGRITFGPLEENPATLGASTFRIDSLFNMSNVGDL